MFGFWGVATADYTEADCFWYLNPNDNEKAVLEAFREQLQQKNALVAGASDDYSLLRFLKAREFQLDKALTMYLDMREWRLENSIDQLYDDDKAGSQWTEVQQLLQVYPHFTFNTDRWGRPVYYELLGKSDATKLFEVITVDRLIRYHCWTWERYLKRYLPACTSKAGRHICTTTVVIDLEGFGLSHFNGNTQKLLQTFSKIDQDHYPEHLGTMLVINTPLIFRGIWAAVQPLLQERTRKKIIILGADYQAELKKYIPEESLPSVYGGTATLDPSYASCGPWDDPQYAAPGQPGPKYGLPDPSVSPRAVESAASREDSVASALEPASSHDAVASVADAMGGLQGLVVSSADEVAAACTNTVTLPAGKATRAADSPKVSSLLDAADRADGFGDDLPEESSVDAVVKVVA